MIYGIGWRMWDWSFRADADNTSCFIYTTDIALAKCKQSSLQVDMIISPSRTPSFNPPRKPWSAQYVEPDNRFVF